MRENFLRATQIIFMFRFYLAFVALTIAFGIYKHSVLSTNPENLDEATLNRVDVIDSLIAMANLLCLIICIIFFIRWFRRAYYNLHTLDGFGNRPRFEEGWAAGGWFVPFMNLIRPYRIMMEIWESNERRANNASSPASVTMVGWWWAVWIIYNVVGNIANRLELKSTDIDTAKAANVMDVISNVFGVIALVLVIKIISVVSTWERQVYEANDAAVLTPNDAGYNQEDSGYAQPYTT